MRIDEHFAKGDRHQRVASSDRYRSTRRRSACLFKRGAVVRLAAPRLVMLCPMRPSMLRPRVSEETASGIKATRKDQARARSIQGERGSAAFISYASFGCATRPSALGS